MGKKNSLFLHGAQWPMLWGMIWREMAKVSSSLFLHSVFNSSLCVCVCVFARLVHIATVWWNTSTVVFLPFPRHLHTPRYRPFPTMLFRAASQDATHRLPLSWKHHQKSTVGSSSTLWFGMKIASFFFFLVNTKDNWQQVSVQTIEYVLWGKIKQLA